MDNYLKEILAFVWYGSIVMVNLKIKKNEKRAAVSNHKVLRRSNSTRITSLERTVVKTSVGGEGRGGV